MIHIESKLAKHTHNRLTVWQPGSRPPQFVKNEKWKMVHYDTDYSEHLTYADTTSYNNVKTKTIFTSIALISLGLP